MEREKVTIRHITKRIGDAPRLTMITAYDYYSAASRTAPGWT